MKKLNKKIKFSYDPEADVLSWDLSGKPIDYASEFGDVIVHFTKEGEPVTIEVLHAKEFVRTAEHTVGPARLHADLAFA